MIETALAAKAVGHMLGRLAVNEYDERKKNDRPHRQRESRDGNRSGPSGVEQQGRDE